MVGGSDGVYGRVCRALWTVHLRNTVQGVRQGVPWDLRNERTVLEGRIDGGGADDTRSGSGFGRNSLS